MNAKWIHSVYFDRIMVVGALLISLCAEAMVIVASIGFPKLHPSLGIGHLLINVLINSVPGVVGLKGYYVVKRLRSNLDAEREQNTLIWLSRQFLAATIFAYGAVIADVVLLTEGLRLK